MGRLNPQLVGCGLVAALALQGCGSGQRSDRSRTTRASYTTAATTLRATVASQAAASARDVGGSVALSPRGVAAEFAMWLANTAANEDEPATPAQVRAYARSMHMSCSAPQFGQYPCSSDTRQRDPSQQVVVVKQLCVAILGQSGRVATGRCSDPGDKVAPVVTPRYVDCATVGKVVTVTDPAGDERDDAQHPLSPTARNHADLTEVRVAATTKSFCADFHTTTPFSANSTLTLEVTGKGTSHLGFTPSISQERDPVPGLYISTPTAVAGDLGFKGDWASLIIPASDSPRTLPAGPFKFSASAEYNVYARTGGYSITDATQSARYP